MRLLLNDLAADVTRMRSRVWSSSVTGRELVIDGGTPAEEGDS